MGQYKLLNGARSAMHQIKLEMLARLRAG